jgi:hypothetical protein
MSSTINDIIPILQISIAPTVLISGASLLILSINNRVIHLLDRTRKLIEDYGNKQEKFVKDEIELLYKRAKILRFSLLNLVLCIIMDVFVIIATFIFKLFLLDNGIIIQIFFTGAILFLIIGLIAYLHDVNKNLKALKIEITHRIG